MLVVEDLLLLTLADDSGRSLVSAMEIDLLLAGGVLVDLILTERIAPEGGKDIGTKTRFVVVDDRPTGDDVLDTALRVIAGKAPMRLDRVLGAVGKGLRRAVLKRLVGQGMLRMKEDRIMKVFRRERFPTDDPAYEQAVIARLVEALRGGTPDSHTAGLIALLSAARAVPTVVPPELAGMTKKELRQSAKRIAEGDRVAESVRRAIQAVHATMIAASTTAVVASTTS